MTVSSASRGCWLFVCWILIMLMMMVSVANAMSATHRWLSRQRYISFRSTLPSSLFRRHSLHMTTNTDNNNNHNNQITNNNTTPTTTTPLPAAVSSLSSIRQSTLSQLLVPSSFALVALAYVSLGDSYSYSLCTMLPRCTLSLLYACVAR